MLKRLFISLTCALANWSTAQACSPLPFTEYETGRTYAYYYPPEAPTQAELVSEGTSIVVLRTELMKQTDAKYGNHRENILRHVILETLTTGAAISLEDHSYSHDPDLSEGKLELGFRVWDRGIINSPETDIGVPSDSCGTRYTKLTLKPDNIYLAFLKKDWDGKLRVVKAAPLDSATDPIVIAYRKVVAQASDAPNRMSAKSYFQNMKDYIELEVLECPKSDDFGFTDSRFGTDDKQVNVLYKLGDRTREPRYPFDLRDIFSYVQQINGESSYVDVDKANCAFGNRYLYVAGDGGKYLKIENGLIDTSKIGTRITITEPTQVRAIDAKSWIREANTP